MMATQLETAPESELKVETSIKPSRISPLRPLLFLPARTALMLLAQGLVALILLRRGSSRPWLDAAPWWTVYGTIVDIGCLTLMWKLTRMEGSSLRALFGTAPLFTIRDLFFGITAFVCVFPFFVAGGMLSAYWIYGATRVDAFPGLLSHRVLPLWAVIYSRSLWWMIWSPTEEMTYNGYCLSRLQSSTRAWIAVLLVGFWWAIQHSFLPFIPDWRSFLWRFLAFVPGVIALMLIYLRTRRLSLLILAHWPMDIVATIMTM
jgi:membrane protease YdiL (CAAX protease family)